MSQKHKVHAEGNAGNTSEPHAESPHAENTSGGHRVESSCGPLVFRALASADVFCFWPIWYFLFLAHIVFSAGCVLSHSLHFLMNPGCHGCNKKKGLDHTLLTLGFSKGCPGAG